MTPSVPGRAVSRDSTAMPRLVRAEGPLHEAILDVTHPLWHDGLTRQGYGQYNHAQMRTRWGAARLSRVALIEGADLLSSAKRYDIVLRLDQSDVPAVG